MRCLALAAIVRSSVGQVAWVASAGLAQSEHPGSAASHARPNILFVFSDDHAWQAISAYGSDRNATPGIDRIAAEGMRFDRCTVTNSICAPSRATILTGLHTHLHGNTSNERLFDAEQQTFPPLLQRAGYQTALIGKWHLRTEPRGFDHVDQLINQGTYYNPRMIRRGELVERTGYTTRIITDLAIDWLRTGRDETRPFMLMCQHKAPHRQWDPDTEDLALFEDADLPEPATLFDDFAGRSDAWSFAEMSIARHLNAADLHLVTPAWQLNADQTARWDAHYAPRNEAFLAARLVGDDLVRWKYQRYAKDYLRCVAAVDDSVAAILDELDRLGLAENTVVIYSSDQGWFLGEHGWFDKRWMYEESFRTPLLVRWPGVTAPGSINRDLVQNLDFAPTFLDIAGIRPEQPVQGRSIVPILEGRTPDDWRQSVYYQFFENRGPHKVPKHRGVSTRDHKLIHFYEIDAWEMYDLRRDPDERTSVHNDPAYAEARAALETELARLMTEYAVTPAADAEYEVFEDTLQQRREFDRLLGPRPRWNGATFETLGVDTTASVRTTRLRASIGGAAVGMRLSEPAAPRRGLLPGVVMVHDGAAAIGGFDTSTAAAQTDADELASRGFAVVAIDRFGYGSESGGLAEYQRAAADLILDGGSAFAHDVQRAVIAAEYLARRGGVHAQRIGVAGRGEGGLIAAFAAFYHEDFAWAATLGPLPSPGLGADDHPARRALLTVPGLRQWGDPGDAIAGMYPRPFVVIGGGQTEAFAKARARYRHRAHEGRLTEAPWPEGVRGAAVLADWIDTECVWGRGETP